MHKALASRSKPKLNNRESSWAFEETPEPTPRPEFPPRYMGPHPSPRGPQKGIVARTWLPTQAAVTPSSDVANSAFRPRPSKPKQTFNHCTQTGPTADTSNCASRLHASKFDARRLIHSPSNLTPLRLLPHKTSLVLILSFTTSLTSSLITFAAPGTHCSPLFHFFIL